MAGERSGIKAAPPGEAKPLDTGKVSESEKVETKALEDEKHELETQSSSDGGPGPDDSHKDSGRIDQGYYPSSSSEYEHEGEKGSCSGDESYDNGAKTADNIEKSVPRSLITGSEPLRHQCSKLSSPRPRVHAVGHMNVQKADEGQRKMLSRAKDLTKQQDEEAANQLIEDPAQLDGYLKEFTRKRKDSTARGKVKRRTYMKWEEIEESGGGRPTCA